MHAVSEYIQFAAHKLCPTYCISKEVESSDPLKTLPSGCLPFNEFSKKFTLGGASTEKSNSITKKLSQIMQEDIAKGLNLLLDVDEKVIDGLNHFVPSIESIAPQLANKIKAKGRIFLVGSGSSGRVAIDLAAKCREVFPENKEQIKGVIAGGETAMIRAKEGFEDSEMDGEKALKDLHISPNDTIILISASGSASFNVGCGHFAANQGANVLYFYNSKEIPERTKQLFNRMNNPIVPLEIDIGPQAISGSTRLQAATLAEACLGSLLASTLYHSQGQIQLANNYPKELVNNMKEGLSIIRKHLNGILKIVENEVNIFSRPQANFRKLQDEGDQGYVTFVAFDDSIREILIDTTETTPTFSTNPIRREGDGTKRPEFCPYLLGKSQNREAWKALLGKEIDDLDQKDTDRFILGCDVRGQNSYENRPKGKGNVLIGVAKLNHSSEITKPLIDALSSAKAQGAETNLILISNGPASATSRRLLSEAKVNSIVMENVPHDALGCTETIILKQTLNLISNGSMVLMKKVYGNQMVDVRASNMKLVDRCIRLIKDLAIDLGFPLQISSEELYHYVCHVNALKTSYEAREKVQVSAVVKIVLAMLYLDKKPTPENFKEVIALLSEKKDDLDSIIFNGTLCIDGGGSKTLLQVIDSQGKILPLVKDGIETDTIQAPGSNINVIGIEGVRKSLEVLVKDVKIKINQTSLSNLLSKIRVVAGMAGTALPENKKNVISLFKELGVNEDKIRLMTDADVAMNLLPGKGIVLLSGTGSICLGKKDDTVYRVGGLGSILGDEGSGHLIALDAIKAVLAEEYGWGPSTNLKPILREAFQVSELKSLIPKINSREIKPAEIAKITPLVFEEAAKGDLVAQSIISQAARNLNQLVETMLKVSNLSNCELHVWGGVFKGKYADAFIKQIESELLKKRSIKIINRAHENGAVSLARETIKI